MAIHTLSIGGTSFTIQPKYASSAGYAATAGRASFASSATYATTAGHAVTAGNAKYATTASYAASAGYADSADVANYAVTAGNTPKAATVLVSGINTARDYPLVFTSSIPGASGTFQIIATDTANSLHYNPSTNVLTVPSFNTSALGVSGGVTIYNGNDLNLQAKSTAATDPGDIAFKNSSGTEIGRIWLDQGTNFKLRYGSSDAAKKIIHEGNIGDYLTTQTMKTLKIATEFSDSGDYIYESYDGSSDVTINDVARAYSAYYAAEAAAAYYASSATFATSANYASSATFATSANYASSASMAMNATASQMLHAATSSSTLYLLGHDSGVSGARRVYKNTNVKITSNALYASAGFYESSDARLKTITSDVEVDFERLKSIPKIQYIKKGETAPHIGTIAQDLQKVYPEFVETGEDGYMSVDYAKLSIIPLKAVDILYDEVKKIKDELKTVKEENQMLKDRLDNIEAIINK